MVRERSLRVFEMSRIDSARERPPLKVDLPVAMARRHQTVQVVFMHSEEFGWHAYVTDDEGSVLLSFPWTDHVDQILMSVDSSALPVNVNEKGWDDLDQGWWAHVVVEGSDVYVAETDLDAIDGLEQFDQVENQAPGVVLVNGVEARWNVTGKRSWDGAWRLAIEACRRGNPTPVGDWADESGDRLVIHSEQ